MQVIPIDSTSYGCYAQLSQHYEAEFSPLTGKTPDKQGFYAIMPLDPTHIGYLACLQQGLPVGFAVVDIGRERFDIAEFYVIPTHRKFGYGRTFAFHIFDLYPGPWQVRQIAGADRAHNFWMSVIREYSQGQMTHDVEDDPDWGSVQIQRFLSRKPPVRI